MTPQQKPHVYLQIESFYTAKSVSVRVPQATYDTALDAADPGCQGARDNICMRYGAAVALRRAFVLWHELDIIEVRRETTACQEPLVADNTPPIEQEELEEELALFDPTEYRYLAPHSHGDYVGCLCVPS